MIQLVRVRQDQFLVGSSTSEPVKSGTGRLKAVDSHYGPVSASARKLAADPSTIYIVGNESESNRCAHSASAALWSFCARARMRTFEAVITPYFSRGIDWLIVVGQNTTCNAGEIWDFGQCKTCASGKRPDASNRNVYCCLP